MSQIEVRVHYPLAGGRLVLRSEADWQRNIEADPGTRGGCRFDFSLDLDHEYLYFKPLLIEGGEESWAAGDDYLAIAGSGRSLDIYPYFRQDASCSACDLRVADRNGAGGEFRYRVFYPPGYGENTLRRYPVLYMHDGQNLFFQREAVNGHHWQIPETLTLLGAMNAIQQVLVVGIYPNQRERDYTSPGYEEYAAFVCGTLKPRIDAEYRTLPGPSNTAVMGSSLGGVVSFYLAWSRPDVFGKAACLSSTFGWRDDLQERVTGGETSPVKLYLDSGWPKDNYEVNRNMRDALVRAGLREGVDLLYLAFPQALHNEQAWATRCHIPLQFLFGHNGRSLTAGV